MSINREMPGMSFSLGHSAAKARGNSTKRSESKVKLEKSASIDPDFEYRGYHMFGKVLGKGSFGVVIECVRKCDNKSVVLKLVKLSRVFKWIAESEVLYLQFHMKKPIYI